MRFCKENIIKLTNGLVDLQNSNNYIQNLHNILREIFQNDCFYKDDILKYSEHIAQLKNNLTLVLWLLYFINEVYSLVNQLTVELIDYEGQFQYNTFNNIINCVGFSSNI